MNLTIVHLPDALGANLYSGGANTWGAATLRVLLPTLLTFTLFFGQSTPVRHLLSLLVIGALGPVAPFPVGPVGPLLLGARLRVA